MSDVKRSTGKDALPRELFRAANLPGASMSNFISGTSVSSVGGTQKL